MKHIIKQIKDKGASGSFMLTGKYCQMEKYIGELVSAVGCRNENIDEVRLKEGESSIGIGAIRDIKRKWSLTNFDNNFRLCLVYQAKSMTLEAQNALLKILEEPPANSAIILLCDDEEDVLGTIRSRCQKINLTGDPEKLKEQTSGLPEELLNGKMNLSERLKLAVKLSEHQNVGMTLDRWYLELVQKAVGDLREEVYFELARETIKAKKLLKSNANKRLILENLLLQFEK